jgi:nucleoside-diphosphate-sugar epimerase|tara:strand:+ start:317 stop:1324 length:1008 start_codon:yes stop_codon:yes gene_type:complete
MKFKSIFITGGAGYVGSRLVPQLLEKGYSVTVYDILYYTKKYLPNENKNLKIIEGDIRDAHKLEAACAYHDVFLNLACISNDASFELDEKLSKSVNFDSFEPMVMAAKKSGIKRFIYASSSSVYGLSSEKNVKEDHPLVPLTLYNKFKGLCEPLLLNNTSKNFEGVIFRPATVCGYAPRQRFDLSVNILTSHAINKKEITVFGGKQLRPNLHIKDYCDAVEVLLNSPGEKVNNEIFNIGYQNMSIADISLCVKKVVEEEFKEFLEIPIKTVESNDNRSYHINSDKIFNSLGFKPKLSIEDAVRELCVEFKKDSFEDPLNNELYFNIKRMKNIQAK